MDIQDELRVVGTYNTFPLFTMVGESKKYNTPVSRVENLKRAIKREQLWTPTTEEIELFAPKIVPDNIARGTVIEKERIKNNYEAGGPDLFGVEWEWVKQVQGSMVRPELPPKVPDISRWEEYISFPDVSSYDWAGMFERCRDCLIPERPTMIFFLNGIFERLISLMGFENAAIALIDDDQKPHVHRFFEKLCGFYDELLKQYEKHYHIDVINFHDDWGSQRSPFFSPELVREMILPYMKHMVESVHSNGTIFDLHSCGKIEQLVPVMIEAGVDIWSGQQMNDQIFVLKEYGKDIMIEAGPLIIMQEYEEEEVAPLTDKFLEDFGPYLKSVLLNNYMWTEIIYNKVYSYSRKAFATGNDSE